ncbi:imidazole glycerol phosphate synthase subunit HisH [[Eubacterium] cellulosolvens]
MSVAVFDYGAGNLFNITLALRRQGLDAKVVDSIPQSSESDGLVLPGVGNFRPAISKLRQYRDRIAELASEGRPVLGICLGMQLVFESSEEGPGEGLGLVKGNVVRLPDSVKIPHMGWNQLNVSKPKGILEGINDGSWCYFVHSYYPNADESIVAARTEYGVPFPSVIESGTLIGTQFHPEKSGKIGAALLGNFAEMLRR